jgi:hypothetical protein
MGRGSGVLLLGSVLGGASVLAACLLPTFSDVLPGATTPDSGGDATPDGADSGLTGCEDTLHPGAFAIWPMTEGSGDVVHDCSGNFPGTFSGNVSWTDGRNGQQALQMSGGFVALVDAAALRIVGPFTVSAWISASNQQVDTFGDVIARYASINTAAFDLTVSKDPLVSLTLFSNSNITQASGPLTYGVFTHVAATYAPGTGNAEMFVNGKATNNVTGPASLQPIPTPMTFGANSVGTSVYFGKIAGIRIYTRVLSQTEITALSQQ